MLKISPLFKPFPEDQHEAILAEFERVEHAPDKVLIEQGQTGASMYLIISGTVEVEAANKQGELVTLAELEAGEFFGEISLLGGVPATATCRTKTPCQLYKLPGASFHMTIAQFPELEAVLKETATERLAANREVVADAPDPAEAGLV